MPQSRRGPAPHTRRNRATHASHMRRAKRSDATYRQSTPLRVTRKRVHASQLFVTRKYLF